MKQIQTKYEAPKAELIEMELQGILCSSAPIEADFNATGMAFQRKSGTWGTEGN